MLVWVCAQPTTDLIRLVGELLNPQLTGIGLVSSGFCRVVVISGETEKQRDANISLDLERSCQIRPRSNEIWRRSRRIWERFLPIRAENLSSLMNFCRIWCISVGSSCVSHQNPLYLVGKVTEKFEKSSELMYFGWVRFHKFWIKRPTIDLPMLSF